jgi:hypothetical protein
MRWYIPKKGSRRRYPLPAPTKPPSACLVAPSTLGPSRPSTGGPGARRGEQRSPPLLPKFDYHLDESDPEVVVLRRDDGSFVAAFSVRGPPRKASSKPPRTTTGLSSENTRGHWA